MTTKRIPQQSENTNKWNNHIVAWRPQERPDGLKNGLTASRTAWRPQEYASVKWPGQQRFTSGFLKAKTPSWYQLFRMCFYSLWHITRQQQMLSQSLMMLKMKNPFHTTLSHNRQQQHVVSMSAPELCITNDKSSSKLKGYSRFLCHI